jgi:hypothetical protein
METSTASPRTATKSSSIGSTCLGNEFGAAKEEVEAMTKIDIDKLSEAELIDLNHRIVERLRFLNQMRAHSQMLDYGIGERVTFHPEGHPPLIGIVTRYNRKTVTVITDAGQHWNVATGLLCRTDARERADTGNAKVVPIKRD